MENVLIRNKSALPQPLDSLCQAEANAPGAQVLPPQHSQTTTSQSVTTRLPFVTVIAPSSFSALQPRENKCCRRIRNKSLHTREVQIQAEINEMSDAFLGPREFKGRAADGGRERTLAEDPGMMTSISPSHRPHLLSIAALNSNQLGRLGGCHPLGSFPHPFAQKQHKNPAFSMVSSGLHQELRSPHSTEPSVYYYTFFSSHELIIHHNA